MDWTYNLKNLKKDFKEDKRFTLFVGAGLNASKNVKLLWNDLIKQACGYSFRRIGNNLSMNSSDVKYLLQLLGVEKIDVNQIVTDQDSNVEDSISDLLRHKDYTTTHFPVEVQVSIIKTLLGDSYIPFLQDYLYSQCNKRKIHKAFNQYTINKNHEAANGNELHTLYVVSRMILLNPQIEKVISYNYDNFLSEAALYIFRNAKRFFTDKEIEFLISRYGLGSVADFDTFIPVIDYGNDWEITEFKSNRRVTRIYHVHGYIPSPDEMQYLEAPRIILSMDEYCSSLNGDSNGFIAIQEQAIKSSNCLFVGLSVTDLSTKRLLNSAHENGKKYAVYILDAYDKSLQSTDSYQKISSILRQIKNSYLETLGASFIDCDKGFEFLFNEIATIKDKSIKE